MSVVPQPVDDEDLEALLRDEPSLRESQPPKVSDLSDLDALLDDSLSTIKDKEQYEADLKARKRGFYGMTKEEIDFCNSRMAAFEAARIWEADYAVHIWALYSCQNCGKDRFVFSRIMEHQKSRHNATTQRWVTVDKPSVPEADQYAVKETRETPTCPRCTEWVLNPLEMTELKEIL